MLAALVPVLLAAHPPIQDTRSYAEMGYPLFGHVVSDAGDVDGDDVPDLLLSDAGYPGIAFKFHPCGYRGVAWVVSGKTGETIHTVVSESEDDGFGAALDGLGDVNGDDRSEWVVGTNDWRDGQPGYATVFSGATGEPLYRLDGGRNGERFGSRVTGIGDADGDGAGDVAVIARGRLHESPGALFVFSGRDGELLFRLDRPGDYSSVARAGDVNGDGHDDMLVRCRTRKRALLVVSGKDGAKLREIVRDGWYEVRGGTDVTGDGRPDLLGTTPEGLDVLSGRDVSLVHHIEIVRSGAFDFLGDVDGDDAVDYLVAERTWSINWGRVHVVSGSTLKPLYTIEGPRPWHFGISADPVGDLNDDGCADFIVGANLSKVHNPGGAWVYSGRDGSCLFEFGRKDKDVAVLFRKPR
jgi:hypothetical protein